MSSEAFKQEPTLTSMFQAIDRIDTQFPHGYNDLKAVVIGGGTGSFLGEYQAGGIILVLGLNAPKIVGNFPCTGMHGGKVYLRTSGKDIVFPPQVSFHLSDGAERAEIGRLVERYCGYFGGDVKKIMDADFITVRPNSGNPYKQMYVSN